MKTIYPLIACFLIFTACKKSDNGSSSQPTGSTYHVKGRLLEDCGGAPLASYAISALSNTTTVARTKTDANGYFDLVCDTLTPDIQLVHDTSLATTDFVIRRQFYGMRFGNTYDWGTIYKSWEQTATFLIRIAPTATTDSIFVGWAYGTNIATAAPAGSSVLFTWRVGGRGYEDFQTDYKQYWGYTQHELDSVVRLNPPSDVFRSSYHLIKAPFKLCGTADTAVITLP